jgi:hypothetical protein
METWKYEQGTYGRIVEIRKMGWVITIEGNTANGKGKEGIFIKKRNVSHPISRILQIKGLVGYNTKNKE